MEAAQEDRNKEAERQILGINKREEIRWEFTLMQVEDYIGNIEVLLDTENGARGNQVLTRAVGKRHFGYVGKGAWMTSV